MPHRNPIKRIGRRGLVLIQCGLIWVFYGLAILNVPRQQVAKINPNAPIQTFLFSLFESRYSGIVWVICGLAAVVFGLLRSRLSMVSYDHYGFNAILAPAIVWALFYFWAWIIYLTSGGQYGYATGTYGTLIWGLFTGFILIISGWPDPSDLPPRYPERAGDSR